MTGRSLRVVLAEDAAIFRDGLSRLLADRGHEVVAAVADGEALVAAIDEQLPDVAVVDIRMPPTFTDEGARAARAIKDARPDLGVLLLSQHIETSHAVALVSLGGFGYLLKDRVLDVGDFLDTAARVASGGSALDPKVVASLVAPPDNGPLARLSERERDVLELMAEGLTNGGIATRLVVSERTVEAHVRHVFMKLDIPESDDGHRRVLAVLSHLRAAHGW